MLKSASISRIASALYVVIGASLTESALAAEPAAKSVVEKHIVKTDDKTWCDRLWEIPTLYKNDDSWFLNEFRIVGRAHFDVYDVDSDVGTDQDWIVRRLRIGGKARLFHNLTFHTEVDLNPQHPDPLYSRLTQAYLAWKFSDAATLTVGKQSAKFTLDGAMSSNEILTIDRNNIANNLWFTTQYISGVSLNGKIGQWQYNTGYFSGGTVSPEFGNFDAGNFWIGSVGYNFGKALGVKQALLRADYVYNDPNIESNATRPFENIGALVFQFDTGRWGFSAEVDAGEGFGTQSNVWGTNVMPWFNITKNLQVVARYTYLASADPGGIRLARYDTSVTSRRGDEYNEIYGGVNYYICGNRLKILNGVSHVWLDNSGTGQGEYHSWQWTTGLRISW